LGKEVPDVKSPRINDGDHMKELLTLVARISMFNVLHRAGEVVAPMLIVALGN